MGNVGNETCADSYAAVLDDLRTAGTAIPTNDIRIAATSFQHGYKLYSRDNHFDLIPGLVRFDDAGA